MKTGFPILFAASLIACSSGGTDAVDQGARAQLEPGGAIFPGGSGQVASSGGGSSTSSASSTGSSSTGSSSSSSSGGGASASTGGDGDDAGAVSDLQHCVDVINSYRATLSGVSPYARSSALEQFAGEDASSDSQTGEAHGRFISTNGGNGIAFAENEIPGWPLDQYGSVTAIIDQGLQMMWAEGPGGGHYENMSSAQYTQAGCGIYVTPDDSVWIAMDFK